MGGRRDEEILLAASATDLFTSSVIRHLQDASAAKIGTYHGDGHGKIFFPYIMRNHGFIVQIGLNKGGNKQKTSG